jgi:1-pyrroline-5-carboxylate dehydrogenase
LNGEVFIKAPLTTCDDDLQKFTDSTYLNFIKFQLKNFELKDPIVYKPSYFIGLLSCPHAGLHNAFSKPERFVLYGDVAFKAAAALRDPEIENYFIRLIQRVCPKSHLQAQIELNTTRKYLENMSGDGGRFMN